MKQTALVIATLVALVHAPVAFGQTSCKVGLETDLLMIELADMHIKMAEMPAGQDKVLFLNEIKKLRIEAAKQFPDLKERLESVIAQRKGSYVDAKTAEERLVGETRAEMSHFIENEALDKALAKLIEEDPETAYPQFLQQLMGSQYKASQMLKAFGKMPDVRDHGYKVLPSWETGPVRRMAKILKEYGVDTGAYLGGKSVIPYDTLALMFGMKAIVKNDLRAGEPEQLLNEIHRVLDRPLDPSKGDPFLLAMSRRIAYDEFRRLFPETEIVEADLPEKPVKAAKRGSAGLLGRLFGRKSPPPLAPQAPQGPPHYLVDRSEVSAEVESLVMKNIDIDAQYDMLGVFQKNRGTMTAKEILYVLERAKAGKDDGLVLKIDQRKLTNAVSNAYVDFSAMRSSVDLSERIPHRLLFAYTAFSKLKVLDLTDAQAERMGEIVDQISAEITGPKTFSSYLAAWLNLRIADLGGLP